MFRLIIVGFASLVGEPDVHHSTRLIIDHVDGRVQCEQMAVAIQRAIEDDLPRVRVTGHHCEPEA